jgi:hypothetical protein
MLLECESMVNFTTSGSNGSMSRKVTPYGISQAINMMRIKN